MIKVTGIYLVLLGIATQVLCNPILTVSYLERPPYYYTKNGKAKGFLIDISKEIFEKANIEVLLKGMPPKRIMREIKDSGTPHCSVGWHQVKERKQYAKFSLPIYQSQSNIVLIRKSERLLFQHIQTTEELFSKKELKLLTLSDFSYGPYIDSQIKRFSPTVQNISGKQKQLAMMIMNRPRNYMLIVPEEIDRMILSANLDRNLFSHIRLKDVSQNNKRYLMCNKAVNENLMKKINRAIQITIMGVKH